MAQRAVLAAGLWLAACAGAWAHAGESSAPLPSGMPHLGSLAAALAAALLLAALERLPRRWLAGAVAALWLWCAPVLALHTVHHLLERGAPHCTVQQIAQTAGPAVVSAGWLPAILVSAPLPSGVAPAQPCAVAAPRPNARASPWA